MKNTKLLIKTVLLFILLPVLLCVGTILAKYAESTLLLVLVLASYVLPACVGYPLFSDAIGRQKRIWITFSIYAVYVPLCLIFERYLLFGQPKDIRAFWCSVLMRSLISLILVYVVMVTRFINYGRGSVRNKILFCTLSAGILFVCTLLQNSWKAIIEKIQPNYNGTIFAVMLVCGMVVVWYSFSIGRGIGLKTESTSTLLPLLISVVKSIVWIAIVALFCGFAMLVAFDSDSLEHPIIKDYVLYVTIGTAIVTSMGVFLPRQKLDNNKNNAY